MAKKKKPKKAKPLPKQKPVKRQPKKAAFLAAYAKIGCIWLAAKAANVAARSHYRWVKNDPRYAKAFEEAYAIATTRLEGEAYRRAMKTSDTLLIFLLKGRKPEVYRERFEHTGPGGGPIQIVKRDDWYGNSAHDSPAEGTAPPEASPPLAGEI